MKAYWVLASIVHLGWCKEDAFTKYAELFGTLNARAEAVVWNGPVLDIDAALDIEPRSAFEIAIYESPSIPKPMADFLRTFVPPDLTANMGLQELSQIVTLLERANYELVRGVEDIKRARRLNEVKTIILGSIYLQKEHMKDLCNRWSEGRRVCRYIAGLTSYFLWVHFCGSLQYPPLINEICHDWPVHLFTEVYLYEKQAMSPDDVSSYFSNMRV
eukprot:Gregarina_sp_Poly_1__415@NODE_10_length_23460_cov_121_463087_g8_i1_p11_GENE_NODE_10_length_23460_cov_121_463087_g8_i1NODE_10_length_23460_cov_121_463087_g8_i1_p11_ORF_typecomplete_len216_score17_04LacAB_rpiB/PF02502_18/0_14_NODE_10_length_23460_cov_121_463087_g8_i126383285